ncbi:MAG: M48 family metallopeptidase [Bacteroidales bacterium]|nr:M48 family metallopeptidase [Bacteroidales bacterium]
MNAKNIYIKEIGNVSLKRSSRAKNVSIAIKQDKEIVLTLPIGVSQKQGLAILNQRIDWIKKGLAKMDARHSKATHFDENTDFTIRGKRLLIKSHCLDKTQIAISQKEIEILYPQQISLNTQQGQIFIKDVITEVLRIEAKHYLPQRTAELAQKYHFEYNKIFIKNNKTSWGSCSYQNNINLNLHLMRLPQTLIDYVILHELCHTVEKNHSKNFWTLMCNTLSNSKELSKELRNFSTQYY